MKNFQAILTCAAFSLAAATLLQAQTPVRVLADNVNLRAKPQLTAEVVAQASYNETLTAREIGEEWVEVAAPTNVSLWVMKQYVQLPQNTIGAPRVNLRAGPSINYNIVDTLALGAQIVPRGEEVQEWLKIAPPASAHVWISREYVEIQSAPEKMAKNEENLKNTDEKTSKNAENEEKSSKKRKKSESADEMPAEVTVSQPAAPIPTPLISPSVPEKDQKVAIREIPVPPPADLKLIPLEGQGRLTEVEGELRAAPLINEAPTRYRIVRWQNNRWQILCHVYGEAIKFRSLQDKVVRIKGREYWIQGAAAPVLIPEQVQEIVPVEGATP